MEKHFIQIERSEPIPTPIANRILDAGVNLLFVTALGSATLLGLMLQS